MDFSGSPTIISPVVMGLFHLTKRSSVRTRIREAMAYQMKNTMAIPNGYFQTPVEINVNSPVNDNGRTGFPSWDIKWLRERYTNNINGGNSAGGYNKIGSIWLHGVLYTEKCGLNPQSMTRIREDAVADVEKLFGTDHSISDESGNHTVFNSILTENEVFGDKANEPRGGVDLILDIYYRIKLTDPTQDF